MTPVQKNKTRIIQPLCVHSLAEEWGQPLSEWVFLWWPWEYLCVFKDSCAATYPQNNGVTKPASSRGQSKHDTKQLLWRENKTSWMHSGTLCKFSECDFKWFAYPVTCPSKSTVNRAFHVQSAAHRSTLAGLWERGSWMRAKLLKTSFVRRSWFCFEWLFLQGELEGAGGGYLSRRMKLPIPADAFLLFHTCFKSCPNSSLLCRVQFRTETDTSVRYRNPSYITRGDVIQ